MQQLLVRMLDAGVPRKEDNNVFGIHVVLGSGHIAILTFALFLSMACTSAENFQDSF
jgi:hypothetical protein